MRGNRFWLGTCGILLVQAATGLAEAGSWTISIGPDARLGMKIHATGSSYVQTLDVSSATESRAMPAPRDVGPSYRFDPDPQNPDGYANRTFDDGFVNMDAGTADPASIFPGLTWFWGYDDPNQYDSANDTLSFHSDTTGQDSQTAVDVQRGREVSRDVLRDGNLQEDDEQNAYGLSLAASRCVLAGEALQVDLRGGLGLMWGSESHMQDSTYSERIQEDTFRIVDRYSYSDQYVYRDTYAYDTTGISPPPAPYSGTLAGPGPLIENVPSSAHRDVLGASRETDRSRTVTQTGSTSWLASNDIDLWVDSSLYNAWLGPRLCFQPRRAIRLIADLRFSLNYVDLHVDRTERFAMDSGAESAGPLREWHDDASRGEWILGMGLALGIEVEVTRSWQIGLHGGYDWMSEDVAVDVGPNTVSLDSSGYALGATVTKVF